VRYLHVAFFVGLAHLWGCSDGGSSALPDAGPPPVDQCKNPSDVAVAWTAAAAADGGIPDSGTSDAGLPYAAVQTITNAVAACMQTGDCSALLLAESPDLPDCLDACLVGTPAEGLSQDCAGCWIELTWCAANHCLTVCATDVYSTACSDCTTLYCLDRLGACTGLPAAPLAP